MNKPSGHILILDDDDDILTAARLLLKPHAASVRTERDPQAIPALLRSDRPDVILLDMNFTRDATSGAEGFHHLSRILEIDPSAVVILITAYGDVEMAVRAIKEGATDFVLKPWQNEKLLATLSSALNLRQSRMDVDRLRSRERLLSADIDRPFHDLIGASPAMQEVFDTVRKVAGTDANVLLLGENGTGKELVARALHRQSNRAEEAFVSVDVGALSETLFESELFGHAKGAFTDAKENRAGRFEIASGGTLFLDEIGNLPLSLQAKLLTAIENRRITRLGANASHPVDVRLICATSAAIHDAVAQRQFRQDLLYRINTVEVRLPPLRERVEDIPLLADHFLRAFSRKYQKSLKRIQAATLKKLERYPWPGNVRELAHAVERAVIMGEGQTLQPSDFLLSVPESPEEKPKEERYNLEEVEREVIRSAIRKHGGNMSRVAKALGLTRTSLYRRLEKYGL